jgi:hypothetical protein
VIRAVNKLQDMGLLKRIATFRPNGKRGVNIIVIENYKHASNLDEEAESNWKPASNNNNMSPHDVTVENVTTVNKVSLNRVHSVKKEKRYNVSNVNILNTQNLSVKESSRLDELSDNLPPDFTPSIVNRELVKVASPFMNAAEVYEVNKRVLIAYRNSGITTPLDSIMDTVTTAFKDTVFAQKRGKLKSFHAYMYRVLEAQFGVIRRREASLNSNAPSWLEGVS